MSKAKRKKAEKGYSYYEYLKKFRPHLLPKEGRRANKDAPPCLSKLVLDKIAPEATENPAPFEEQR